MQFGILLTLLILPYVVGRYQVLEGWLEGGLANQSLTEAVYEYFPSLVLVGVWVTQTRHYVGHDILVTQQLWSEDN